MIFYGTANCHFFLISSSYYSVSNPISTICCSQLPLLTSLTPVCCRYKYQPLDHIRDYFGEQIAIYFAWLGEQLFHIFCATCLYNKKQSFFMVFYLAVDNFLTKKLITNEKSVENKYCLILSIIRHCLCLWQCLTVVRVLHWLAAPRCRGWSQCVPLWSLHSGSQHQCSRSVQ